MDNAEKLTRLGLQDTGRRQKQIKTKTMSNTDHKPLPLGGGGVNPGAREGQAVPASYKTPLRLPILCWQPLKYVRFNLCIVA